MHFSAIRTVNTFPAIKQMTPKILTAFSAYALGDQCGGNFHYTKEGIKDCSKCGLPHKRDNFGYITGKYNEIMEIAKKNRRNPDKG